MIKILLYEPKSPFESYDLSKIFDKYAYGHCFNKSSLDSREPKYVVSEIEDLCKALRILDPSHQVRRELCHNSPIPGHPGLQKR